MNKPIKFVLIGLMVLIIGMGLLELIFKAIEHFSAQPKEKGKSTYTQKPDKPSVDSKEAENKKGNAEIPKNNSVTSKGATDLYSDISDFLELAGSGKYQEAYDMLEPKYRELYYPDIERFTELCKTNFTSSSEMIPEVIYFDMINASTYTCKIRVSENHPDVIEPSVIYYVTLHYSSNDKYTIAFDGFVYSMPVDIKAEMGKVRFNISNITYYHNRVDLLLKVNNEETNTVSLLDVEAENVMDNIKLVNTHGSMEYKDGLSMDYDMLQSYGFKINPNSSGEFKLEFNVLPTRTLKSIEFDNIKVGNMIKTLKIDLNGDI